MVSWLRETLPDLAEDEDEMKRDYSISWMYFRYVLYKEIIQLFSKKPILSGFTVKGEKDMAFVGYG